MPEENNNGGEGAQNQQGDKSTGGSESGGEGFKAPQSQEELDRIIGARLKRERERFADYDDLREKAEKYDKAEQANKTELQRAQERAEKAERQAAEFQMQSLRASVAADKGVPAAGLTGSTKEELEASADALIAWRDEQAKKGRPDPRRLRSGSSGGEQLTGKERAAAALRQMRTGT